MIYQHKRLNKFLIAIATSLIIISGSSAYAAEKEQENPANIINTWIAIAVGLVGLGAITVGATNSINRNKEDLQKDLNSLKLLIQTDLTNTRDILKVEILAVKENAAKELAETKETANTKLGEWKEEVRKDISHNKESADSKLSSLKEEVSKLHSKLEVAMMGSDSEAELSKSNFVNLQKEVQRLLSIMDSRLRDLEEFQKKNGYRERTYFNREIDSL